MSKIDIVHTKIKETAISTLQFEKILLPLRLKNKILYGIFFQDAQVPCRTSQ